MVVLHFDCFPQNGGWSDIWIVGDEAQSKYLCELKNLLSSAESGFSVHVSSKQLPDQGGVQAHFLPSYSVFFLSHDPTSLFYLEHSELARIKFLTSRPPQLHIPLLQNNIYPKWSAILWASRTCSLIP